MRIFLTAAAITTLLTACQTGAEREAIRQSALIDVAPVGEPVDCINTSLIRESHVRSDRVVDFEMNNGDVFRNTLPNACSNLNFERRFIYRTTVGRLCSIDTITVLNSGGTPGVTCGLGQFQKVRSTAR